MPAGKARSFSAALIAGTDRAISVGQAAAMLRVSTKTVTRWADSGRVACARTAGGHRRFSERQFSLMLAGKPWKIYDNQ